MNLVTLLNEDQITLASGKLVYSASETGALLSAVAAAESIATAYATADERISTAVEDGRQQGYKDGFETGLQEGKQQISAELVRLAEQSQMHTDQQRSDTTQMALEIVRKVVGTFAPDKTLAALAVVAAGECGRDESITLRVHPKHSEAVRHRLANGVSTGVAASLSPVVADASLDEYACVLETQHGSVIADLETQLLAIQKSLGGG